MKINRHHAQIQDAESYVFTAFFGYFTVVLILSTYWNFDFAAGKTSEAVMIGPFTLALSTKCAA